MDRGSYQLGGVVIALAGLGGILAGALHPPQPETLEAFADAGTRWTISHVAIAVTGVMLAVSALFLARDFSGASGEGWALAGSGALLLGGVALLLVGATETVGFSGLAATGGVAAEHGFVAVTSVMVSAATMMAFLAPAAVAAVGAGMVKNATWPGWLGWSGVVLGLGLFAVAALGVSLGPLGVASLYLINGWIVVAGVLFLRKEGSVAARPPATRTEPSREDPIPARAPASEPPAGW